MVVSIRDLVNIQFPTSILSYLTSQIFSSNMKMDVSIDSILREKSNLPSKSNSRSSLVFSNISSISYHEWMEINNNKPEKDIRKPVDSSQLSYENDMSKGKSVSRMADISFADRTQYISNKVLILNNAPQTWGKTNNNNRSNSSQQVTFNVKFTNDGLSFSLFYFPFSFSFHFIFLFFYF